MIVMMRDLENQEIGRQKGLKKGRREGRREILASLVEQGLISVKTAAEQEGITEDLKRRDQMAWVGAMNNIRNRVNEIVLNAVIFV